MRIATAMLEIVPINYIQLYRSITDALQVLMIDETTLPIVGFLLGFLLGFVGGYSFGIGIRDATDSQMRHGIAMLITLAWLLSLVLDALEPAYRTPMAVHAMMGAVAGYLFRLEGGSFPFVFGRSRDRDRDRDRDPQLQSEPGPELEQPPQQPPAENTTDSQTDGGQENER